MKVINERDSSLINFKASEFVLNLVNIYVLLARLLNFWINELTRHCVCYVL